MNSPFVRTPAGTAVVEVATGTECFVRFEDGSRDWVSEADCEQVEVPAGYAPPSTRDIAGCLA